MFDSITIEIDNIKIIDIPQNDSTMQNIRVAIVEDLAEVKEGLKYVLDYTEGFECVAAYADAESAVENINKQFVDIIVMDIHLPKMSGIECVRNIIRISPNIQFLMFSVFEDDDNIFEALKAGASGYLLKKTPPHKVLEAIKDLADGGSPMSANIARKVIAHFKTPQKNTEEFNLSVREKEILDLLSKGFYYKEISEKMGTTIGTVRQQIHKIYEKLHVQNKTDAINKVFGKA